ncbi:MAG: hypothetical protein ACJ8FS_08790 [Sphingomicrobium sp.]
MTRNETLSYLEFVCSTLANDEIFDAAHVLENRAFLNALRGTGNVRLACRELGLKYGTM